MVLTNEICGPEMALISYPERIAVTASGSGSLLRPDDATEMTGLASVSVCWPGSSVLLFLPLSHILAGWWRCA